MAQIHTPEAHAITGGSRSVLVGDIDSGMDFEHPDLAPNYDAANSTDCSSGAPATLPPDNDLLGHGTHTAGTIAAALERRRHRRCRAERADRRASRPISAGLLPVSGDDRLRVHVGRHAPHGRHATTATSPTRGCSTAATIPSNGRSGTRSGGRSSSRCSQGVVVVAAAGNFADDLAHPTQDIISPDTGRARCGGSATTAP